MAIRWFVPADSSAVLRAGYDDARGALHVVFAGGRRYVYLAVPPELFELLRLAPSVGQFVNGVVKPVYSFRQAEPAGR